jgi:hypothetical protein
MQQQKIIRLQSDDDYIDFKAYSSQNDEAIKTDLITNVLYWENYYAFLLKKYNNSQYPFSNISEWLKNLSNHNQITQSFPSLENTALQFINRNIFQYSLIPQSLKFLNFASHFPYPIHILGEQKLGSSLNFDTQLHETSLIKEKPINKKEFKIIRVIDASINIFVDLKTRITNEKDILYTLFNVPFFLRDYHLISRTKILQNAQNNIDYELNKKLFSFYNPSIEYIIDPSKALLNYNNPLLKQLSIFPEFNFLHLVNQLMFMKPGMFLPLTQREVKWSNENKPDSSIYVRSNSPLNLISTTIDNVSTIEQAQETVVSFIEKIKERDSIFNPHQESSMENNFPNTLLYAPNEKMFLYVFEQSLIKSFKSLSFFDNPEDNNNGNKLVD